MWLASTGTGNLPAGDADSAHCSADPAAPHSAAGGWRPRAAWRRRGRGALPVAATARTSARRRASRHTHLCTESRRRDGISPPPSALAASVGLPTTCAGAASTTSRGGSVRLGRRVPERERKARTRPATSPERMATGTTATGQRSVAARRPAARVVIVSSGGACALTRSSIARIREVAFALPISSPGLVGVDAEFPRELRMLLDELGQQVLLPGGDRADRAAAGSVLSASAASAYGSASRPTRARSSVCVRAWICSSSQPRLIREAPVGVTRLGRELLPPLLELREPARAS